MSIAIVKENLIVIHGNVTLLRFKLSVSIQRYEILEIGKNEKNHSYAFIF